MGRKMDEDGCVLFQFFNFCEKSSIFLIITVSFEFEKKLKAFQFFQHSEIIKKITMLEKRRFIHITEIIEAAAGEPCVICQHPAMVVHHSGRGKQGPGEWNPGKLEKAVHCTMCAG
jgi:hypothetical protein